MSKYKVSRIFLFQVKEVAQMIAYGSQQYTVQMLEYSSH